MTGATRTAAVRIAAVSFAALGALACSRTASCLGGGDSCHVVSPCTSLAYTCAAPSVFVGKVKDAPGGLPFSGPDVQASPDDILIRNDRIAAVIDALDTPHVLAPTGGSIIDLAPVGGNDQLNQIYQVAGILPADAAHYTSLTLDDHSPDYVGVELHGVLDGRPDVTIATRYEIHPCEPGVRVRTDLYNGSAEPFTFFLADASFWGNREPTPFVPVAGEGFLTPKLDLVNIDPAFGQFPFVAARATAAPSVAYAALSCDRDLIEGINDPQVSALGEPRQIVRPGESLSFERDWLVAAGPDVQSVARLAHQARGMLRGGEPTITVTGRVVAAGAAGGAPVPQGGDDTHASVLVSEVLADGTTRPWTEVIPGADGVYHATVPAGVPLRAEVSSFGRARVTTAIAAADLDVTLDDQTIPAPAHLHLLTKHGGVAITAMVALIPADAATRDGTLGTLHGRQDECAPWLGPPHGGSPACNHVVVPGAAELDLPAGHYWVYGSIGPFGSLARKEITVAPSGDAGVSLDLEPLPSIARGRLSADLHVHGRASFDSSVPDEDRVLTFAAYGMDVIAATDHDAVRDYADTVTSLGLDGKFVVVGGIETTGLIPFLSVPGSSFPKVIGHFNFWPIEVHLDQPRGGAPWDELAEPGELFDRMDTVLPADGSGMAMLNHPWDDSQNGRDLGYLRAVGWDPRTVIPMSDDGTAAGMLVRRPAGRKSNLDFNVVEVLNGRSIMKYLKYRALWWSLLSQGHVYAGAANSDSHGLTDVQLGWPRNLVTTSTTVAAFDVRAFDADVRAGHMSGGYGVVIDATVDGHPFGLATVTPRAGATLDLEVRAAPWIPVTEIRVYVNGRQVKTIDGAAITQPADPFAADGTGVVRFHGSIALADLVGGAGVHGDAWLLVEAGVPLPAAADLDDDGVVDTADNNGDGVIDRRDIAAGEDSGPIDDPLDPTDEGDPRFHVTAVAPQTWPLGFTNPWLLDLDGDGVWTAPGL